MFNNLLIHIVNALVIGTPPVYLVKVFVLVSLLSAATCEIGCGNVAATCAALHVTFKMTLGPKPAGRIEKCTAEVL